VDAAAAWEVATSICAPSGSREAEATRLMRACTTSRKTVTVGATRRRPHGGRRLEETVAGEV
jgi:hypothetical protein